MKKYLFNVILFIFFCFTAKSQITILSESFDDITLLPGQGWVEINKSNPIGSIGYFQGNTTVFPPYQTSGYIAVNYNSVTGANTISNWLITPQLTLQNGDVIKFWTRTVAASSWPDRLQVRLNMSGTTNVGPDANSVGDFTIPLLDINPNLTVGGYPETWTEYTITLSGIPVPTLCRIAFRYYVTNGGPNGANSNYIGIDEFKITRPIPPACVVCPPAGLPETESCGMHINDGYDHTGAFFATLLLNNDLCGTIYANSTNDRDVDWYSFPVATPARYKFSLFADNDMHFQLIDITTTQTPIHITTATACDTTTFEICLLPGTYAIRLLSVNTSGISCLGNNAYVLRGVIVPSPQFLTAGSNSPICAGDTLHLWASGGIGYEWMGPLGFNSNIADPVIPNATIANSGTYSVNAIDVNNCVNLTSVNVVILDCTNIKENNLSSLQIYPNPTQEYVTLQTKEPLNGKYSVQIYNEQGQLISTSSHEFTAQSKVILSINLPAGFYTMQLIDNNLKSAGIATFIVQ